MISVISIIKILISISPATSFVHPFQSVLIDPMTLDFRIEIPPADWETGMLMVTATLRQIWMCFRQ